MATATRQLSEEARQMLATLADILIPAAVPMPSASQSGVAGKWLDRVLDARPDLAEPLAELLEGARGRSAEAHVKALYERGAPEFEVLANVVSAAYYMNPKVRKLIGYPGQAQNPIYSDEAEYDLRDGLLDPVLRRFGAKVIWPTGAVTAPPEPVPISRSTGRSGSSRAMPR